MTTTRSPATTAVVCPPEEVSIAPTGTEVLPAATVPSTPG